MITKITMTDQNFDNYDYKDILDASTFDLTI